MKKDLTGMTFGKLTVIKEAGKDKSRCIVWLCKCSCGKEVKVKSTSLITGHSKSCGCLQKDTARKHGMFGTRFYGIWRNMKSRCTNPKDRSYKNYGGRGISYSPSWEDFNNFYNDMYEAYQEHCRENTEAQTTLERIDVNGGYIKENCKWATPKEQANNRRNSVLIDIEGETLTLAQASEKLNINYQTASKRLKAGKDVFGNKENLL